MERYTGRVALVTGASAGIGAAITQALLRHGVTVVGLARRVDRIKALESNDAPGKLYALEGDVRNEEQILSAFKWINDHLGGVDILINNAGVAQDSDLTAAPTEEWRKTFEINVLGLSICTREAVQGMFQRGVNDGFIINISSTGGLRSPSTPSLCMYSASKHAVQVLTEGLRKDLADKKSGIRVTSICPGLVKTEIMDNLKILDKKRIYSKLSYLQPEHIADAVVYVLSQPAILEAPMLVIQHVGQGRIIESQ
ncbi:dehydrogenase/reductase SDR family member 11-like [Schistocerca cancellata]|uniref:dehydrogenase/reductase SDR family member 11-like n=1 Tax=Schistocerca cancellata TaxID=274614 RepID=UPI0021189504|nr:dehydrogenase/reductase SDR family member 11-like [Schistocerca cancellata]